MGIKYHVLIFAIFCPIITIIALVVVKVQHLDFKKQAGGFYVVLLLGIASIVLTAINISDIATRVL